MYVSAEAQDLIHRVKDKSKLKACGLTQAEIDELYGADNESQVKGMALRSEIKEEYEMQNLMSKEQ
jgi:hypothetical protein